MRSPYGFDDIDGETGTYSLSEVLDAALCRLPLHVAVHRRNGEIAYLNAAVADALELDRSAALGKRVGDLQRRSPELGLSFERLVDSVFETGFETVTSMKIPTRHGLRSFKVTITPWFSPDGSTVELAIVVGELLSEDDRSLDPASRDRPTTTGGDPAGNQRAPDNVLTPRQAQVLKLTAEGFAAKEIAPLLGISVRTVESHKGVLSRKIGATSRSAYFTYAREHGYL